MTDAKDYLKSFKREEAIIQLKSRQLQSLRDRLQSISVPMDKEQVSHTKNVEVMSETIALIVDMEKEIDQQTTKLIESKRKAYRLFDKINPNSAVLLMDRYMEGKKNSMICEERFITDRHLRRLMSEAIRELQIILNQMEQDQESCPEMSG